MVCSKILSISGKSLPRGFLQTKTAKMLVPTFQPLKQMLVESSMQCAHAHKQKTHTHTDTLNLQRVWKEKMSVSVKRSRCHQGRLLCEFRRGAWPIWHVAMLPTTIGRPQPNWRVPLCCLPSHLTHWQTRKPSLWGTTMSLWAEESGSLEGNKRGGKTSIYFLLPDTSRIL